MIILTSPAKSLTESGDYPGVKLSQPQLLDQAKVVHKVLAKCSSKELQSVMSISEDLGDLNRQRFKVWTGTHSQKNSRPAIFMFNGDVFKAMHIAEYDADQLEYCNQNLRILSGLYGVLRPFDLMQPYRLEMGTKVQIEGKKLVEYWQQFTAKTIAIDLAGQKHPFVLNLASQEYFESIDTSIIKHPIIDVRFLQHGKRGLQTYGMLAKKARGMMIDYCITTQAQTVANIADFKGDGYTLTEQTETSLTFAQH